jgi:hypothetical protein
LSAGAGLAAGLSARAGLSAGAAVSAVLDRQALAAVSAAVSMSARALGTIAHHKTTTQIARPPQLLGEANLLTRIFAVAGYAQPGSAVGRHREVEAAYTVAGEASAVVHVRARDAAHLEETLERIRDHSGSPPPSSRCSGVIGSAGPTSPYSC